MDQMIESRSEVVGNVSDDYADTRLRLRDILDPKNGLPFRTKIGKGHTRIVREHFVNLPFKLS